MRLTPRLFGWALWWRGCAYSFDWGYAASYSYSLGPFSLEQGYVG